MVSRLSKITKLVNSNYDTILKGIKILEPNHTKIFNSLVKERDGETLNAYTGNLVCGEACFIGKYLLENEGFKVAVWKNSYGLGKNFHDHCFLLVDKQYVVDLTAKQFWQDERTDNNNCPYHQYIQYQLPPFFITSREELDKQLDKIIYKNETVYGKTYFHDIFKYWKFQEDVSGKFDLMECVKNNKHLTTKPLYYLELINLLPRK